MNSFYHSLGKNVNHHLVDNYVVLNTVVHGHDWNWVPLNKVFFLATQVDRVKTVRIGTVVVLGSTWHLLISV